MQIRVAVILVVVHVYMGGSKMVMGITLLSYVYSLSVSEDVNCAVRMTSCIPIERKAVLACHYIAYYII